jgi:glutathione S-transferase
MNLYYNPLACSLASRITIYEGELAATMIEVDTSTKRTADGVDYRTIYPLALVPALTLDDGTLLTESAAVLPYLADRVPEKHLAPAAGHARTLLHQWLAFIGSELHKGFAPLLDKHATAEVKAYARAKLLPKLAFADAYLASHEFLLDGFSVADAYLFAVLNWTQVTDIALADYPSLRAFHGRMLARPAVKRAFDEESRLYVAELSRASDRRDTAVRPTR